MVRLTSKIQYKHFEIGESIEEKKRNYLEFLELIEKFPWSKQREKVIIDLTNPSITIEGENNDFLKLAVFFNEKYVLHYFNSDEVIYTKSFIKLSDTYKYIKNFFEPKTFEISDFKKEYPGCNKI